MSSVPFSRRRNFGENGHWFNKKGKRVVFQQGELLKRMDTVTKANGKRCVRHQSENPKKTFVYTVRIWREWTLVQNNGKRFVCQQGRELSKRFDSTRWEFEENGHWEKQQAFGPSKSERLKKIDAAEKWQALDTTGGRFVFQQDKSLKTYKLVWKITSVGRNIHWFQKWRAFHFSNKARIWRDWALVQTNGRHFVVQQGGNLKKIGTGTNGNRFIFPQNENLKKIDTGTEWQAFYFWERWEVVDTEH